MGKIILGLWWILVLAGGWFAGFVLIFTIDKPVMLISRGIRVMKFPVLIVSILFVMGAIALLIAGLAGITVHWYQIGVLALVSGFLFQLSETIDLGGRSWEAVRRYRDDPGLLERLIVDEPNTRENIPHIAKRVFVDEENIVQEISDQARQLIGDDAINDWQGELHKNMQKSLSRGDRRIIRAIEDGLHLPEDWYLNCPYCKGPVRLDATGSEVECICDGDCGRSISSFNVSRYQAVENVPQGSLLDNPELIPEALEKLDLELQKFPDDPDRWFTRAVLLQQIAEYDGALRSFEKCLSIDFSYPEAWVGLANMLGTQKKFYEVLDLCERFESAGLSDYRIHNFKGIAYYHLDNPERAETSLLKFVSLAEGIPQMEETVSYAKSILQKINAIHN